jgi:hypothetical protein
MLWKPFRSLSGERPSVASRMDRRAALTSSILEANADVTGRRRRPIPQGIPSRRTVAAGAAERSPSVMSTPLSRTFTFVDGSWLEGNPALVGPRSHVFWLGSSVFDGARWFEGLAPDLDRHAARVNRSALALGLRPTVEAEEIVRLTHEGLQRFDGGTAVYIRPMYWAEDGGYMGVPADPETTRFCLCLYESPMIASAGFSLTVSPFRRPTPESMPTTPAPSARRCRVASTTRSCATPSATWRKPAPRTSSSPKTAWR